MHQKKRATGLRPEVEVTRPSGVYPSPLEVGPALPVRVAYLLRAGLRPPERDGVVALLEPTDDARPMNAYVVDSRADRERVLARITAWTAARADPIALPPRLLLCGPCDPELADIALGAGAEGIGVDLADGMAAVARTGAAHGRAHAASDPVSKLAWYHAGLGEWVAALYADYGFTSAQLRVLALLGVGVAVRELAGLLGCTEGAINHHTQRMRNEAGKVSTEALLARMQRRLQVQLDPTLVVRTPPRLLADPRTPPGGCPM